MEEEEIVKEQETAFLLTTFTSDILKEFYIFSQNEGKKIIFLSSTGGAYASCVGFLDIINRNPEEYTIRVAEFALSSGLQFLRFVNCPIEDVSSQYNLDVWYIWHSTQEVYSYRKEELKQTLLTDQKDFEEIKHVLTKKQIRKRSVYYFWVRKWKHLARVLNDDLYLDREQIKELLGEKYSVRERQEV